MSDIKDIMGVSRAGAPSEKQEKPKEQKLVKPKGMSREAFALLSSTHPLAPSQLMGELKKSEAKDKPKRRGQVSYQYRTFKNPARSDDLELSHWVKCYKDAATGDIAPADKEYPFLKYNKKNQILKYNDEEWSSLVSADPKWTRKETDFLFDLVESLDMKWLAIADRYSYADVHANTNEQHPTRTVEDLKERYYTVARELLLGREGGPTAVVNTPLVKHPFNASYERERKKGLELLFHRDPALDAEEDIVLAEAAKIEAKRKAESGALRKGGSTSGTVLGGAASAAAQPGTQMIEVSEIEVEPPVGTPPLFDVHGKPAMPVAVPVTDAPEGTPLPPPPRVVARVAHTRELINTIYATTEPEKNRKLLEGSMVELKLGDLPRAPSRAVCGAYLALIREVLEHLELKRTLAAKSALIGTKRIKTEDDFDVDMDGEHRSEKRQRVMKRPSSYGE